MEWGYQSHSSLMLCMRTMVVLKKPSIGFSIWKRVSKKTLNAVLQSYGDCREYMNSHSFLYWKIICQPKCYGRCCEKTAVCYAWVLEVFIAFKGEYVIDPPLTKTCKKMFTLLVTMLFTDSGEHWTYREDEAILNGTQEDIDHVKKCHSAEAVDKRRAFLTTYFKWNLNSVW